MGRTLGIDVKPYFLTLGHRIEETDALDIATVTAIAGVRDHYMVKRPLFRTTACKSNRDHRDKTSTIFVNRDTGQSSPAEKRAFYAKSLESEASAENKIIFKQVSEFATSSNIFTF